MTAFDERYPDAGSDFVPSDLEQAQAERLQQLEAELEELRAQAANPAVGAVEQPTQAPQEPARPTREDLLAAAEAIGSATSADAHLAAVKSYNDLVAEVNRPQVAPPPIASMTPDEARAAISKAADEATSWDDLRRRYRELGIMEQGYAL